MHHRGLPGPQSGRILLRLSLLVMLPLIGAVFGLRWYLQAERFVTTDNAYVKSNLIAVSPAVDGRVVSVAVEDNQGVRAGDLLFTIDPRPFEIALAGARARLRSVANEIASMKAQHAQIEAELADARERRRFLERRREREHGLAERGMSTQSKLDEVDYQVTEARQRERALEQRARQALAELGGTADVDHRAHSKYLEALAARDATRLNLEYTQVRAPVNGQVSRMKLQAGEWVESGQTVFGLVQADALWVEANLKETQMTHVHVGQEATLVADAYPDVTWRGEVASISGATGSEFLVLPAQNATGNWVKVVQRLPVRIELLRDDGRSTLRAGMTVTVSIDTERERELLAMVREATAALVKR